MLYSNAVFDFIAAYKTLKGTALTQMQMQLAWESQI